MLVREEESRLPGGTLVGMNLKAQGHSLDCTELGRFDRRASASQLRVVFRPRRSEQGLQQLANGSMEDGMHPLRRDLGKGLEDETTLVHGGMRQGEGLA